MTKFKLAFIFPLKALRNLAMTGDETTAPLVNLCASWMIDHPLHVGRGEDQRSGRSPNALRSLGDIRNYLVRTFYY